MTKSLIIVPMLALLGACGQGTTGGNTSATSFSYAGKSLSLPAAADVKQASASLPPMASAPDLPVPAGPNPLLGAWVPVNAEHEECEAKLVFTSTQVTVTPSGGGNPETDEVTYQNEGASTVYVTSRDRSEKQKVIVGAGGEIVSDDCTYKRLTI